MTDGNVLAREAPALLILTDDPERSATLKITLEASGWRVRLGRNGHVSGFDAPDEPASLVLLDLSRPGQGIGAAADIRRSGRCESMAPILGFGPREDGEFDPKSTGIDALIDGSAGDRALAGVLEDWRPVPLDSTRRIADMFGAGPIAGMIERLALRLKAAMTGLDNGGIDQAEAHRLAGLCGTLGFGQAHAAWLDLSLGDQSALGEVRRTTRLTLAAIARGL